MIPNLLSYTYFRSFVLGKLSELWDKGEYDFENLWEQQAKKWSFFKIISHKIPDTLAQQHLLVNRVLQCLENE